MAKKQQLTTEQNQQQRLVLEQQRILGIMLEKNGPEINEYIDNKIEEIQALEKKPEDTETGGYNTGDDPDEGDEKGVTPNDSAEKGEKNENDEDGLDDDFRLGNKKDVESAPDIGFNETGDPDEVSWYRTNINNRSRDDEYYEPTAVSEKTLQEFLNDQLGMIELDDTQLVIAQAIVGNLDDDGFLRRSTSEIADDVTFNDNCMVESDQVEQVLLDVVQQLEPTGIAARNLQECILLQLYSKPKSEEVDIAIKIIKDYFDEFKRSNVIESLSRKMKLDKEIIENVISNVIQRGLNPKPGSAFGSRSHTSQQVTPDFDVEVDEETKRLTVTLRNNIPELQISESYALMNERYKSGRQLNKTEAKEKKSITDAYQRASMFIELLKQRQQTLFDTMSAIVKLQKDYFLSGDERDLKPLGQQQIAEIIGKDVSAVSRAVNNKYVQLPWGVKSLKSFFSEDINGASRHEVYDDLKKLVDEEDKAHPLSDDALCEKLKAMGYKLERRTVAKYRDTLNIPSSTIRRRKS